jgi:predicted PurR-regulated permease PerM
LHVVEGYLLIHNVMQRGTHLPSPVVILSILVFGTLFGTLGIVLAAPLGTAIYGWLNETVYAARGSESSVIAPSARAACGEMKQAASIVQSRCS